MNHSEWENTKQLMLPYDGGASQVHLLAIPKKDIYFALKVIAKKVLDPKVVVISSETLKNSITLSEVIKNKTLITKFSLGKSIVSAKIFDRTDITFDIWAEEGKRTFDLEVWFWADQFFPGEDVSNLKRFNKLLSMLNSIVRENSHKCILTPNEASDPLEDLSNGYGIEIQLENT